MQPTPATPSIHDQNQPASLTIPRPDDFHLHLRSGAILATVLPDTARQFARAMVMPNLQPPITTVQAALDYRDEIMRALPAGMDFEPLMSLYLTPTTTPAEIERLANSSAVVAVKLYPAGATTHSEHGVHDLAPLYPTLAAMQQHGVPLMVHGEVTDPQVDLFDREAVFIERVLQPLLNDFPELRVVLEHITTEDAVQFVLSCPQPTDGRKLRLAATITAHHLRYNRNAMFIGGVRPHYYCLPVLKRERHRQALLTAACSGDSRFFLGTDSAPHPSRQKESACGCAGCYTARHAMPLYAQTFAEQQALDKLAGFASQFGAQFYGLPQNQQTLTLLRQAQTIEPSIEIAAGNDSIIPLAANETLQWRIADMA